MNRVHIESRPNSRYSEYQRHYMRRIDKGIDWSILVNKYTILGLVVIPAFYQVLLLVKG